MFLRKPRAPATGTRMKNHRKNATAGSGSDHDWLAATRCGAARPTPLASATGFSGSAQLEEAPSASDGDADEKPSQKCRGQIRIGSRFGSGQRGVVRHAQRPSLALRAFQEVPSSRKPRAPATGTRIKTIAKTRRSDQGRITIGSWQRGVVRHVQRPSLSATGFFSGTREA